MLDLYCFLWAWRWLVKFEMCRPCCNNIHHMNIVVFDYYIPFLDNIDNIRNYATLLIIMAYFSIFFTEFSETIFDIRALLQIFIRVDKYSSVKPFFTFKIKEIRYCWVSCACLAFLECFKHYRNVCRLVTSMGTWDFICVLQGVPCISLVVTCKLKGNSNWN
jgi:hypothetical protein